MSQSLLDHSVSPPPQASGTAVAPQVEVRIIERRRGWQALQLRELWRYRELLYFLTWRDVAVRYKQSVFGAAWAILQPVATMVVFSMVFGRLAGLGAQTGDIPYPLFVFAGLLPWQLFSRSVASASNSVVASSHVITKIYFPRLVIPLAALGVNLVDFVVCLVVLAGMMAWYGVFSGLSILLFPLALVLTCLAALAVGIYLSALSVAYRDFQYVVPFTLQIWMYLSPVIYPVSLIPQQWRWLLKLNPLTGLIDGFRYSLLGQPLDWYAFGYAAVVTLTGFLASVLLFRRVEATFADIV